MLLYIISVIMQPIKLLLMSECVHVRMCVCLYTEQMFPVNNRNERKPYPSREMMFSFPVTALAICSARSLASDLQCEI